MAARAAPKLRLTAPIVREPVLHKQIADTLRIEIAAPRYFSREGVTWFSVDMAAYAGAVPGIRTGRGCIAGVADIHVYYRGRVFLIEVKADDGLLSPAQTEFAATCTACGVPIGFARNASEALALLDQWDIPRAHRIRG